jgi:hypothetical protein
MKNEFIFSTKHFFVLLFCLSCLSVAKGQVVKTYDINENFTNATSPWTFTAANQFTASIANAGGNYGNALQLQFTAATASRTTTASLNTTIPDDGKICLDFDWHLGIPNNSGQTGIFIRFKDSSGKTSIAFSTAGTTGNVLHLVNLDNTVTTDPTASSTLITPAGGTFARDTWVSVHAVLNFTGQRIDTIKITNGTATYQGLNIAFYNTGVTGLSTFEVYANRVSGVNLNWTGLIDNFKVYHYETVFSPLEYPVDVSSKIVNPGFETDFQGWTIQNGVSGSNTIAPVITTTYRRAGSKSAEFPISYGEAITTELRVYQTITGLTPGRYELVAYKSNGRWEASNGIFASSGLGEKKSVGTSSSDNFTEHKVVFWVGQDGTAIIGGYAAARRTASDRGNTFRLDDFELYLVESDPPHDVVNNPYQMEYLTRGISAIKVSGGVLVSWRSLGTDPKAGTAFKVYRGSTLIKTTTDTEATCYLDASGTTSSVYKVETYINGVLVDTSKTVGTWANFYNTIQLNRPAGGTTPDGVEYTYTPNDCSVADLDGDGEYEIVVKWDPSNSKDNGQSGYTGNVYLDAYKFYTNTNNGSITSNQMWRIDLGKNIRAGAHYTQFMVYDLDGDGKAEVACKTAPGTNDSKNVSVIMGNDSPTADYRVSTGSQAGHIISGPEYLTVFNGQTGAQITSIAYEPPRGTVSDWGDEYGNRVNRHLAAIAYIDGEHPSLIMCRGYYSRIALACYDYSNGTLSRRWFYDSGFTAGNGAYGQGNHNLSVGDVDGDGKDEIIYGASAFDDDGSLMYRTGFGHGDAMHLTDIDPNRPGLEVWEVHEETDSPYGYEMHDAKTGQVIFGKQTGSDVGRGLLADIDPGYPGFEMWSSEGDGIYSCTGVKIADYIPKSNTTALTNFRIYWDGDLQDELLDGTKLCKWNSASRNNSSNADRLKTLDGYSNAKEINGTKSNPCLSADILGDWREEIIYYNSSDPSQLVIFTTDAATTHRLYTLMHDRVYRLGVAWQNVGYNQPPHLGFYIGDGLSNVPVPNIKPFKGTNSALSPVNENNYTGLLDHQRSNLSAYSENQMIYVSTGSSDLIRQIAIYNMQGKLIYANNQINVNTYSIPCNMGTSEIYIVKLITDNEAKTVKLIVK